VVLVLVDNSGSGGGSDMSAMRCGALRIKVGYEMAIDRMIDSSDKESLSSASFDLTV
jgi:hypothetical protein